MDTFKPYPVSVHSGVGEDLEEYFRDKQGVTESMRRAVADIFPSYLCTIYK